MLLSQIKSVFDVFTASAPVDIEGLCGALGLSVKSEPMESSVSGKLERVGDSDNFCITTNSKHSTTRQRFTIAHELAHWVWHRQFIGAGVSDSVAFRSTDKALYVGTSITDAHETEANQFAATWLMPRELVLDAHSSNPDWSTSDLADHFGVSEKAMSIRLASLSV